MSRTLSRISRNLTLALGVTLLGAPVLLSAQPGPGVGGERRSGITHLLNARRQLDLTPRQISQLDSLERIQYAERKQFNERMRGARDSMQAQARARMEAERPQFDQRRRRDSSMTAAAEHVLNDTQRQKVREMTAERRGMSPRRPPLERPAGRSAP